MNELSNRFSEEVEEKQDQQKNKNELKRKEDEFVAVEKEDEAVTEEMIRRA